MRGLYSFWSLNFNFSDFLKTFLTLDLLGLGVALFMGVLILIFGGSEGLWFLLIIILFLVVSALVTRFKKGRKIAMKTYERARGWKNVVANGAVPLIASFAFFLNAHYNYTRPEILVVAYVASVASITADKFSSEIGILDNRVLDILTLKRTRPGKSGGVSALGIAAGAVGAFIISLGLLSFSNAMALMAVVVFSGLAGDLADSVLGYFEEKGIGNKYTSNFVCAVVGVAISIVCVTLLL